MSRADGSVRTRPMLVQGAGSAAQVRAFMHLDGPSEHRGLCGARTNKLYKVWGLSLEHVGFEVCESCSAIAQSS